MHYFIIALMLSIFVFVSTFLFNDEEEKVEKIVYRCLSFLIILIALLGIVLKF